MGRPDPFDRKEMAAVGLCMNRIILKAQTTFEGEKRDEIVDDLEYARQELIHKPMPKQNAAKAEKSAKQNGPKI